MLSEHYKTTSLLSDLINKTGVVVEGPNVTFVTTVEKNGSDLIQVLLLVVVGLIDDVSHSESSVYIVSKVIKLGLEIVGQWHCRSAAHE